jgi:glycine hydroxymethyltransferase
MPSLQTTTHEEVQRYAVLSQQDHEVFSIIERENRRRQKSIDMIASANIVSPGVLEAMGSSFMNNVVEGYPGQRYFSGCEEMDKLENLGMDRAKRLFGATHANLQPYSCSQANQAVYLCSLKPGDRILGMDLKHGGHLTHGAKVTMTAHHYASHSYKVSPDNGQIDYDQLLVQAKTVRPKLIIAGASAYPRIIDFKRFREIADEVEAFLLGDMAHIAGLVAAEAHPSPVPHAHFVTTSTQKTLRGPRGGMILLGEETAAAFAQRIDRALFPGIQGAAHMHTLAAKAVALGEALRPNFVTYQRRVLDNAKTLAEALMQCGFQLITGGTDNHLMVLDLRRQNITGEEAENRLESVDIMVNKNLIPYDPQPPWVCSGIRIGTAAMTTQGYGPEEMRALATMIDKVLRGTPTAQTIREVRREVSALGLHHQAERPESKQNGFPAAPSEELMEVD